MILRKSRGEFNDSQRASSSTDAFLAERNQLKSSLIEEVDKGVPRRVSGHVETSKPAA